MLRCVFNASSAAAVMLISLPALAQPVGHAHFSPAGATISGTGIGNVAGTECLVTVTGTVGPAVSEGPDHTTHAEYATVTLTNHTYPGCDGKIVYAKIRANGSYLITGDVGLGGCGAVPPVPGTATLTNDPVTPLSVSAVVPPVFYGGCPLYAGLNVTGATIVHP